MRVNPHVFPKIALVMWISALAFVVGGAYSGQRWMGRVAEVLIIGMFVLLSAGLVILRYRRRK